MSEATNGELHGREVLLQRLEALGIDVKIVAYPKHTTIEEGKHLRGDLDGVFTKNLLLKDKKGRLFLVAADEDNYVDLKSLHTLVGARGRLGFASAEEMRRVLA
ncbi:MAG: YbaK/EbsC family protein [Ilumatobacteraceae bacterium]